MTLQINGDNLEITEDMKATLDSKLAKPLDKHLRDMAEDLRVAHVKVKRVPDEHVRVNFDIHLPGKKHIFAEATEENFMGAVVALRHEVERQISDYMDRLHTKSGSTLFDDQLTSPAV